MASLDWIPSAIQERSNLRELDAGESLFRQGDETFAIFGMEQLFAEAALFADAYHCDAIAAIASKVRVYPKREILASFRGDPALAERFMAILAHEVHALRARLEERDIRSARQRLLHHLALATGPGGRTIPLDGTLMDLASEIGVRRAKAASFQWVKTPPGQLAPAGSNRSSHGGNEMAEAFG